MAGKRRFETGVLLGHIQLTEKQQRYYKIMVDKNTRIVFLSGPSGSAKSFLSVYSALDLYNNDKSKTITYLRTAIESSSKSLGFLKGGIEQKFSSYLVPFEEKLSDILNSEEKQKITKSGVVSAEPINFIRGQDWKNKVVIADEMQNATLKELLTIVTRINKNTKIFICGDVMQSDIRDSGFLDMFNLFNDQESQARGIHCLEFDKSDIMRDPVVSYIVERVESIL